MSFEIKRGKGERKGEEKKEKRGKHGKQRGTKRICNISVSNLISRAGRFTIAVAHPARKYPPTKIYYEAISRKNFCIPKYSLEIKIYISPHITDIPMEQGKRGVTLFEQR